MMNDRELKRKKAMLSASTELLKLGGSIREIIEEEYMSLYPEPITDLICEDHEIDANFFKIADEVMEVKEELDQEQYEYFSSDETSEDEKRSRPPMAFFDKYKRWYLEQIVRLCYEKYEKGGGHFWQDWDMTFKAKKRMSRFNLLEERILYLSWGLDQNGKKRLPSTIAALPEFACDPALISQVRKVIKGYIYDSVSNDMVQREIIKRCEEERNIIAQK